VPGIGHFYRTIFVAPLRVANWKWNAGQLSSELMANSFRNAWSAKFGISGRFYWNTHGLDEIFFEIDKRHNRYILASYNRARYFSQHGIGVDATITDVLEYISKEEVPTDFISEAFPLQEIKQVSEKSLYTPRKPSVPFRPELHVIVPIPEELKRDLKNKQLLRLQNTITVEKTREYVFSRMGERNEILVEELAPQNFEEFLYLAYVYLYGYQKNSRFVLIRSENDRILHIGPYHFIDHRIRRSERG
jgi:hypothetical protein